MKPPSSEWAPWLYRGLMVVMGIVATVFLIWLILIIKGPSWGIETASQRLSILGNLALGFLAILFAQQIGYVARNLIRNFKGTAGLFSVEVNSRDQEDEPK